MKDGTQTMSYLPVSLSISLIKSEVLSDLITWAQSNVVKGIPYLLVGGCGRCKFFEKRVG